MTDGSNARPIREAVGFFTSLDTLQQAIDDLLSSGFNRAELSLLASEEAVTSELGHIYSNVADLEDDQCVPRRAYVSAESLGDAEGALIGAPLYIAATFATGAILTSGGTLLAAIIGAVAAGGAGAALGGILAKLFEAKQAQRIEDQLDHGGLLLWVRTWDSADEARAVDIMKRHSGHDVHVHGAAQP